MAKKAPTAKQKAAQKRLAAASRKASKEGKKGKAFRNRVKQLLKGTGSGKSKPRGGSTAGKSNPGRSNKMGIGKGYTMAKGAVLVLSPATGEVLRKTRIRNRRGDQRVLTEDTLNNIGTKFTQADPYANVLVTLGDAFLDKKTAHVGALSGGSVTAWAPEAFLLLKAHDKVQGPDQKLDRNTIEAIHNDLVMIHNGYSPRGNEWIGWQRNPDGTFTAGLTYRVLRHGGQAARMIGNRTSIGAKLKAPFMPFFKELGIRL